MKYQCPICKKTIKTSRRSKPQEVEFFPFCSARCKLIDLGAWFDAKYQITSKLPPEQAEEEADNSHKTSMDKID